MCTSNNSSKFKIQGYLTDFKSSCKPPIDLIADTQIQSLENTEIEKFESEKFRHALFGLNLPKWKLVTEIEVSSKENGITKAKQIIKNFVTTFRLLKSGNVEIRLISAVDKEHEKFIEATHLRTFAGTMYEFTDKDIENFQKIYNHVSCINDKRILNALERFNLSYHDFRFEDKIIDYIISLESLFNDGRGEIAFKLAYRSARILGLKKYPPDDVFDFMKEAYNRRSNPVHGQKRKSNNEEEFARQLQDYTREILKITIEKPERLNVVLNKTFGNVI